VRPYLPSALLLAAGLACSACAVSAGAMTENTDTSTAEQATGVADQAGEQLIAQPPAGWRRTGTTNIGNLRRAEYIPEDEPVDDSGQAWTRRITFESMKEDPLPDPIEFIELMNSDRDYACGTFNAYPTFSGLENGYPTSVHLLVCHRDRVTERAEVSMIKTIQGNEHFYVITRAWRGPPIPKDEAPPLDETEIGGWALYMKSIQVCDPSRAEAHPCP
jgi:hypothetical protein